MKLSNLPVGAVIKSVRNSDVFFIRIKSKNLVTAELDNGCHVSLEYDIQCNMIQYPMEEEEL